MLRCGKLLRLKARAVTADWTYLRRAQLPAIAEYRNNNFVRVHTEYSRGFGDWLIEHQVALICSTYLTGHVLFIWRWY